MTIRQKLSAVWFQISGRRREVENLLAWFASEAAHLEERRAHHAAKLAIAKRQKKSQRFAAQMLAFYTNALLEDAREAACLRAELQQKGASHG